MVRQRMIPERGHATPEYLIRCAVSLALEGEDIRHFLEK